MLSFLDNLNAPLQIASIVFVVICTLIILAMSQKMIWYTLAYISMVIMDYAEVIYKKVFKDA